MKKNIIEWTALKKKNRIKNKEEAYQAIYIVVRGTVEDRKIITWTRLAILHVLGLIKCTHINNMNIVLLVIDLIFCQHLIKQLLIVVVLICFYSLEVIIFILGHRSFYRSEKSLWFTGLCPHK